MLFGSEGFPGGGAVGHDGVEVDGLGRGGGIFQAGQGQQAVDHAGEAFDFLDGLVEAGVGARVEVGLEVLQPQAQGGEGGF
ncbi:hypothetical protein ACFYTG_32195 [Streptomyces mirabilis]|uniref:hypothetical protein n=1 Tax=Streptomyces mirabilis TaxID=68239 RepID=UPI0036C78113